MAGSGGSIWELGFVIFNFCYFNFLKFKFEDKLKIFKTENVKILNSSDENLIFIFSCELNFYSLIQKICAKYTSFLFVLLFAQINIINHKKYKKFEFLKKKKSLNDHVSLSLQNKYKMNKRV